MFVFPGYRPMMGELLNTERIKFLQPFARYLSIHPSIYLWLYSPFVGPWPLFQFLNPIQDSLDGGSAHRKAAIYTENNKNTELTHTHINSLSVIRTHDPRVRSSEDSSCLRPRGHCDGELVSYIYIRTNGIKITNVGIQEG
jgi:hypothetical protein